METCLKKTITDSQKKEICEFCEIVKELIKRYVFAPHEEKKSLITSLGNGCDNFF